MYKLSISQLEFGHSVMLPSSSSSSSYIHPASLVHSSLHSPLLLQLVDAKMSIQLIRYVVDCVSTAVIGRRGRSSSRRPEMVKFATFVVNVLTRATTPIVLASLVYINRAKPHLHFCVLGGEALEHALNRAFLGALIIASKYLNDFTLHNKHWAMCTGILGTDLVGLIERDI
ncbi:hypothetical protein BT96DRAFT_991855 [Gymnopus androsaceus JB14]|uniref:Cyclin N-terminal domain-containing protein n=1 Tax=Gymnopus androsaceus JB14 TaxID=1447944 RepID=A0A6A4HV11_9AGAR|nr:hypothetical protein BT96DRAFT_991855 [Gymnopus androsaceus JB14]